LVPSLAGEEGDITMGPEKRRKRQSPKRVTHNTNPVPGELIIMEYCILKVWKRRGGGSSKI